MTVSDAFEAHSTALSYGGGRDAVSNLTSLLGSLGRPYHGHHRPIHKKTAALLHGVATSHGFVDANKRTAWLLTDLLVERSGYSLELQEDDAIDDLVVNVVTGDMSESQLAQWIRAG
ncbi:MAG: type II toxin-antitoxin system death-on-curing family toxin [Mameliella sp.]|nr:type II toxin-antitoxin system death-on-curing family toxin [Mameliella sp.]